MNLVLKFRGLIKGGYDEGDKDFMGIGGPGETWEKSCRYLSPEEERAQGRERVKARIDPSGDWYSVNYAMERDSTSGKPIPPFKAYRFQAPDDNSAIRRVMDKSVLSEIAESEHVGLFEISFVTLDKLNSTGRFVARRVLEERDLSDR